MRLNYEGQSPAQSGRNEYQAKAPPGHFQEYPVGHLDSILREAGCNRRPANPSAPGGYQYHADNGGEQCVFDEDGGYSTLARLYIARHARNTSR